MGQETTVKVIIYSSKMWIMTRRNREQLELFEIWHWRRMEGIRWTVRNTKYR